MRGWLGERTELLEYFDAASWEARNALSATYALSMRDECGDTVTLTVESTEQPGEAANRICFLASQLLARTWGDFTRAFVLSRVPAFA